jgi:hypothetical protein
VAGGDLDSSLIVPLIKRVEPDGAGGSSPLSWPGAGTPVAGELAGELYVFCRSGLPGAFRLVSRRDRARMQPDAGGRRPLAVRNLTRRVPGRRSSRHPLPPCSCWTATWKPASC